MMIFSLFIIFITKIFFFTLLGTEENNTLLSLPSELVNQVNPTTQETPLNKTHETGKLNVLLHNMFTKYIKHNFPFRLF